VKGTITQQGKAISRGTKHS